MLGWGSCASVTLATVLVTPLLPVGGHPTLPMYRRRKQWCSILKYEIKCRWSQAALRPGKRR